LLLLVIFYFDQRDEFYIINQQTGSRTMIAQLRAFFQQDGRPFVRARWYAGNTNI
jgi:hypothetical protein